MTDQEHEQEEYDTFMHDTNLPPTPQELEQMGMEHMLMTRNELFLEMSKIMVRSLR